MLRIVWLSYAALMLAVGCGRYTHEHPSLLSDDAGSEESNAGSAGMDAGAAGSAGMDAGAAGGESLDAGADGDATDADASVSIVILPSTAPSARLGVTYLVSFSAQGGTPGYTFQLASGALPPGLLLNPDGTLSGMAEQLGTFSFEVRVTDAAGNTAVAAYELEVVRARWLANLSFQSSASSATGLSLLDLQRPDVAAVWLDQQSGVGIGFSPDAQWYLYGSRNDQARYDYYLVNVAGDQPSAPIRLVSSESSSGCKWAPSSSKLACFKDTGSAGASTTELVSFATVQGMVGPEVQLATLPLRAAGAAIGTERALAFLDDDTLVCSNGPDDFVRIEWHDGTASSPLALGLDIPGIGGGSILKLSPDHGRALVRRLVGSSTTSNALVDFRSDRVTLLDQPGFQVSDAFDVGFAFEPPATTGPVQTRYTYYSIAGIDVKLVGEQTEPGYDNPVLSGGKVACRMNGRLAVVTILPESIDAQPVPGDYQSSDTELYGYTLGASGSWLYVASAQRNAQDALDWTTSKHWLSHVAADGPAPTEVVAQGFYAQFGDAAFSPDGRWLALGGYDSHDTSVVPFNLFGLADPQKIETFSLDLPLFWGQASWSPDSTYLGFVGGNPLTSSRPEYVVDTLALTSPPRKVMECGPDHPSTPICPAGVVFQP